jgi:RNA polymerase sigma-70 factor (ECF subfamily)
MLEMVSIWPPLEVASNLHDKMGEVTVEAQVEQKVLMERLIETMNNDLSDDEKHVVILRFLEDFSLIDTAEIIGKDVNNVKVIQHRGLARLKKAMIRDDESVDVGFSSPNTNASLISQD